MFMFENLSVAGIQEAVNVDEEEEKRTTRKNFRSKSPKKDSYCRFNCRHSLHHSRTTNTIPNISYHRLNNFPDLHWHNLFSHDSKVAIRKSLEEGDGRKSEASSCKCMSSVRHKSQKEHEILSKMRKENTNQKALTKLEKQRPYRIYI